MIPVVDVDIKEPELKAVQDVVKSKYLVEGKEQNLLQLS